MASSVKWYGDEVRKNLDAEIDAKFEEACRLVLNEARRMVHTPKHGTPPPPGRRNENWPVPRSAPGEAPARQTDRLAGALTLGADESIVRKVKRNWWRVGTNVEYHLPLERPKGGGQVKEARPLMEPALKRVWPRIKALFGAI